MSSATARGLRTAAIGTVLILGLLAARAGSARRRPAAPPEHQEPAPTAVPARRAGRRLLSVAGAAGAAVAIAVAGAGASYALWTGTVPLDGGTISAGSTTITVNGAQDYTVALGQKVGPGNPVYTTLVLANTGSSAVTTTATTTAFAQSRALADNLTVTIAPLAVGESCGAGVAGAAAPLVGFSGALPSIPAGASVRVCLGLVLAAAAPASVQGGTASFTITIDAVQVARS
jgi:hypothetical protein